MASETESGKKRVLVADDEPSIRYFVRRILGNIYSVIEASNGEEAVDLTQRHKPDIVLMDVTMPGKDGFTACAEIKTGKDTSVIPIIMLTGLDYRLNKETTAGPNGYISKPFKPQELLDTIKRFL